MNLRSPTMMNQGKGKYISFSYESMIIVGSFEQCYKLTYSELYTYDVVETIIKDE